MPITYILALTGLALWGLWVYFDILAMKKELHENTFEDIKPDLHEFLHRYKWSILLTIFKRAIIVAFIVVGIYAVIYFSIFYVLFRRIAIIYVLVVLWLTHSGIVGEIFEKKGYRKISGNLIGFVPIYGLIQAVKLQPRKQILPGTFRSVVGFKEIVMKMLTFGFLTMAAMIVAFPVVYLIGSSFTDTSDLPTLLWPTSDLFTWQNYVALFDDTQFLTWYKNTFIIAVLSMLLGVVFVTGAGYVFARFKFKGKKAGLMTILVLQVFPSFMGLIAMFTLFQVFGLLGRPTWLTILYVGGSVPGNIWLIKGYLSQIPKDLDESAMLDGANKFQIFFKIIMPLSVPILSFVAVGLFMAPWMDYMLPKYLLDVQLAGSTDPDAVQKQWTIAVGLFSMIQNPQSSSYTMFASGALIVAVPITVLYMIFQRYLIEGIAAGATKG